MVYDRSVAGQTGAGGASVITGSLTVLKCGQWIRGMVERALEGVKGELTGYMRVYEGVLIMN